MVPPLAYFASGGNYPILGSPPLSPTIPAVRPSRLTLGGANAPRMNKGLGTYCSDSFPDCLVRQWGELSNDHDITTTALGALTFYRKGCRTNRKV